MFSGSIALELDPVVHAGDAREILNGRFGHGPVVGVGNRAGQGHDTVLDLGLDRVVLEVGLEDIRLLGGGLDAVVRVRCKQRNA